MKIKNFMIEVEDLYNNGFNVAQIADKLNAPIHFVQEVIDIIKQRKDHESD